MPVSITIYAGGKTKGTPWDCLIKDYLKRINLWSILLIDVDCWEKVLKKIENQQKPVILLDHRGECLDSFKFSKTLNHWMLHDHVPIFCIGSFNGFPEKIQKKSSQRLSFGSMTWCHQMARLMLVEQLYRSQQLLLNHPYALV